MKLSKESIDKILDLHKGMSSYVLCFGESDKTILIKNIIENSGGKLVSSEYVRKERNTELRYTVLIFVGRINESELNDVERVLVRLGKRAKVILDLTGIKLSMNRRDIALSFIRKYNISIIKGTDEELKAIMKANDKFSYEKKLTKHDRNIIYLAREFSTIVIERNQNYLTDGYNEFKINDINKDIIDDNIFELIYSSLIANCVCNCDESGQIIQSIILRLIALNIKVNDKIISLDQFSNIYKLVENVMDIDSEALSREYRVCYYFKR